MGWCECYLKTIMVLRSLNSRITLLIHGLCVSKARPFRCYLLLWAYSVLIWRALHMLSALSRKFRYHNVINIRRRLTLSERGRHCRTCRAPRRTRRWPAGRSWFVWGAGAGAGGAARHAAAATSPQGAWPLTAWAPRTALHSTTPAQLAAALRARRRRAGLGRARPDAAADTDVRLTVREPGIHFLIAASAHAPRSSQT